MRRGFSVLGVMLLAAVCACGPQKPACPDVPVGGRFLSEEEIRQAQAATPAPYASPVVVQLGGNKLVADRVVSGPLCNDTWRGIVYVTCDVKVAEWVETPTFLRSCNLNIEPGTIVYVAAHNNTAYYQGCSCHTGVAAGP